MIKTHDDFTDACCINCLYSNNDNDDDALQCHRYPPVVLISGTKFPVVDNSDFCAEFRLED